MPQPGQHIGESRLRDRPRPAHDGDLRLTLDRPQRPEQIGGGEEGRAGEDRVQAGGRLRPRAVTQGKARPGRRPEAGRNVAHQRHRILVVAQDAQLDASGIGQPAEFGRHARQGQQGRALRGHPQPLQPCAGMDCRSEVGEVAGHAGQVLQVGGNREEGQVGAAPQGLLKLLLAFAVVHANLFTCRPL